MTKPKEKTRGGYKGLPVKGYQWLEGHTDQNTNVLLFPKIAFEGEGLLF